MYPFFWWLAVHKSIVIATRFGKFAKNFAMLSLWTWCIFIISCLIVFLDTTLNNGCKQLQNLQKQEWSTIDKGYSCTHIINTRSFLATSWLELVLSKLTLPSHVQKTYTSIHIFWQFEFLLFRTHWCMPSRTSVAVVLQVCCAGVWLSGKIMMTQIIYSSPSLLTILF
jgi:hypothetical protein